MLYPDHAHSLHAVILRRSNTVIWTHAERDETLKTNKQSVDALSASRLRFLQAIQYRSTPLFVMTDIYSAPRLRTAPQLFLRSQLTCDVSPKGYMRVSELIGCGVLHAVSSWLDICSSVRFLRWILCYLVLYWFVLGSTLYQAHTHPELCTFPVCLRSSARGPTFRAATSLPCAIEYIALLLWFGS